MLNKIVNKIKLFIIRLNCDHNMKLNRWHLVHYPEYEPLCVEAEYICTECGEVEYEYYRGEERLRWKNAMGDIKKV